MKKLNVYLENLPPDKRIYLGNIASFAADFLIIFYFSKIIDTYVTKQLVFAVLTTMGYQGATLSHTDFLQFKGILTANMQMMLFGFIIFHGIIYVCGALKKIWAINYVKRYAFMGSLLSALEFVFYIKNGNGINFFTLTTIILYALAYKCLKEIKSTYK